MVLGVGACHGETISINLMLMLVLFFYAGEENLIEITDYLFELDKTHIYQPPPSETDERLRNFP